MAQLGHVRKLGLACATWSCVCASGAEVGPKTSPTWETRCGAALDPTGAQVGTNWPCWAEVGPKATQIGSKLKPLLRMEIQVGSNMPQLGTFWRQLSWAQRRHNMGNIWEHCFKQSLIDSKKTGVLRMSDWSGYFPHFEAILTSTWAEVAPKWVEVGFQVHAKLRYLVAQLVQVGGLAGRS